MTIEFPGWNAGMDSPWDYFPPEENPSKSAMNISSSIFMTAFDDGLWRSVASPLKCPLIHLNFPQENRAARHDNGLPEIPAFVPPQPLLTI